MSVQVNTLSELKTLPPLKPTLKVTDGGFDFWQDRVWILTDDIEDKYYYLGRLEYEIISRWDISDIDQLIETVNTETVLNIQRSNVETIMRFLLNCNLLIVSSKVMAEIKKSRESIITKFMKNAGKLFFFKIPLINPENFLNKTIEYVRPVFSQNVFYGILVLLIINVYLLASNWGSFSGSLPPFNDFSSILLILFTMFITKIFHEFGHAYACKMHGGKVPEMGVTFIFFYPLLYTDVSSSMMLDADKRLQVSTAGIRIELYLAIIAGFFWFFVPDEMLLKNLLFFVAAISWLISITINIIPFIKFDGYYILSDYLKIRNLSVRANAVYKYYLRKYFFGIDAKSSETYNSSKFKFLLTFSIMTGIYRIFVFTGILLFLYYIQVVGAVFFTVGVLLFLIIPMGRELYNIWLLRGNIVKPKNAIVTCMSVLIILVLLFIPFGRNVYLPAMMYAKTQRIYAPFEVQISELLVAQNNRVKKGDKLVTLMSPKLTSDKIINLLKLDSEQYYSAGVTLTDETRKKLLEKKSDVAYQETIKENLNIKSEQLELFAPFDGVVTAVTHGVYQNTWLADKSWILDLVDFNQRQAQAFITAIDKEEVSSFGIDNIIFIPDNLAFPICDLKITSIAKQPVHKIPKKPLVPLRLAKSELLSSNLLFFSTNFGGSITMVEDEENNWVPVQSFFAVELVPTQLQSCNYDNNQMIKGVIKIKANKKSIAARAYRKISLMFLNS